MSLRLVHPVEDAGFVEDAIEDVGRGHGPSWKSCAVSWQNAKPTLRH